MVLEATVLVLDNSEWMRNGDYTPTRMEAQNDAVTFLFNAKTQMNPENMVGLMTLAGKSPEVLVTLTRELGKVLTALHTARISGKINLATGVQIAQLALKHRQNKNQRQRIIVFVGSPVEEDEKALVRLGKKLKKNSVAVDVVNFGEENENTPKLEAFVAAVNSNDNSHLVTIPPGPHILSDVLLSSPIVAGEDGAPPGISTGSGFEFGVDPNLDPELALALRMSMDEERARQEASTRPEGGASSSGGADSMVVDSASSAPGGSSGNSDEDEMLRQALAISMGGAEGDMELSEDDQMAQALALSMGGQGGEQALDINSIISGLPGINMDDPRLKAALEGKKEDEKKDGKDSGSK